LVIAMLELAPVDRRRVSSTGASGTGLNGRVP
jgi:hypothetical protein